MVDTPSRAPNALLCGLGENACVPGHRLTGGAENLVLGGAADSDPSRSQEGRTVGRYVPKLQWLPSKSQAEYSFEP